MSSYYFMLVVLFSLSNYASAKSATYKIDGGYAVITSLSFSPSEVILLPGNNNVRTQIAVTEYKNNTHNWYRSFDRRCTSWDDAYNLFRSYVGVRLPRDSTASGGNRADYLLMMCTFGPTYAFITFDGVLGEVKPDPLPPPPRPSCVIGGYADITFSLNSNDSSIKNTDSIVRCSANADFKMTINRISYNFADGVYASAVFDNMDTQIIYRNVLSVTNRVRVTAGSNGARASTSSATYLVTLELL